MIRQRSYSGGELLNLLSVSRWDNLDLGFRKLVVKLPVLLDPI